MRSATDLVAFLESIRDCDLNSTIREADREAVRYEYRTGGRSRGSRDAREGQIRYAEQLKGLIFFLRFGIKPNGVSDEVFQLFRPLCEALVAKGQLLPAVLNCFAKKG
jgi:hypothetical protein